MKNLLKDLGWLADVAILTDSQVAEAIASQRGVGRVKHIDVQHLSVQHTLSGSLPSRRSRGR